jgi:hypothetical protein
MNDNVTSLLPPEDLLPPPPPLFEDLPLLPLFDLEGL